MMTSKLDPRLRPSPESRRGGAGFVSRGWRWIAQERALVLIAVLSITILFGAIYVVLDNGLRSWTDRDLNRRATLIWSAVSADAQNASADDLLRRFEALSGEDRLVGVLACWPGGRAIANNELAGRLTCTSPLTRAALVAEGSSIISRLSGNEVHVNAHRLSPDGSKWLVIVQDRTFVSSRRQRVLRVVLIAAEIALLSGLLLGRLALNLGRRRFTSAARDMVSQIQQQQSVPDDLPAELRPLAREVSVALDNLRLRRTKNGDESGPARLRRLVASEMPDTALVVVANREPYVHERTEEGETRVNQPASGLVSGIEPLLRACGGTWVAHGGGSADRETADANGRVAVPPDHPEYILRRVFLSEQEVDGYYFGFSNEGLWPLCHIAHTRPIFRPGDWAAYQAANRKFARATLDEGGTDGLVLVQDYHFALLPRMIRESASDAVISLFWHIPWPNWEVIGICPWKEELLDGMLGADVLGFHTRYHCLNFLETAQRYLECRVDLDSMSVEYNRHRTVVRPYPISIEWPYPAAPRHAGTALRSALGISPDAHVMIGVDRTDYTKGLIERLAAVERALELHPDLIGKLVYAQLAAPSRTRIKRYREVISDLEEAALRVNRRFGTLSYKPVVLQVRTFSPEEVRVYYAMSDSALVTPLHDGMNLVAKEYVASCEDGDGALVLSTFAGAAKELEGALIVNPYDPDEVARAICQAATMSPEEKKERMKMMREQIARNSIYDWSGKLLRHMSEVRSRRDRARAQGAAADSVPLEPARPW